MAAVKLIFLTLLRKVTVQEMLNESYARTLFCLCLQYTKLYVFLKPFLN